MELGRRYFISLIAHLIKIIKIGNQYMFHQNVVCSFIFNLAVIKASVDNIFKKFETHVSLFVLSLG